MCDLKKLDRLIVINYGLLSHNIVSERIKASFKMWNSLYGMESMLKQKSRQKWLVDGDTN